MLDEYRELATISLGVVLFERRTLNLLVIAMHCFPRLSILYLVSVGVILFLVQALGLTSYVLTESKLL